MHLRTLLGLGLAQSTVTASLATPRGPWFDWDETKYVVALGDSYTFIQGTLGWPGYSYLGDYASPEGFKLTPEELRNSKIVQNFTGTSAGGPNWIEFLTGCGLKPGLTHPSECTTQLWDLAFAGANTAEKFLPLHHDYTTPFVNQTQQWIADADPVVAKRWDKKKALVAIWIGINDINDANRYYDGDDFAAFYDAIIAGIFEQGVKPLYDEGYHNFLLVNLPPLDRTQSAQQSANPLPSKEQIGWWNDIMSRRGKAFAKSNRRSKVMVYDTNTFLNGVLDNPAEYGIKNTTHFCLGSKNETALTNPELFGCTPLNTYFWYDSGHISSRVHELLVSDLVPFLKSHSTK